MREVSAGFRVPLTRVTISPGDRLAAFLIEVTRDRMGIIRDLTDVLRDLGLNLHNISAYVEGGGERST
jgi:UTP:GlnB (protein PII) uridylyltransferase